MVWWSFGVPGAIPPLSAVFAGISVYFLLTGITGLAMVGQAGWPERVFYGGALLTAVVLSQLAARARGRSSSDA